VALKEKTVIEFLNAFQKARIVLRLHSKHLSTCIRPRQSRRQKWHGRTTPRYASPRRHEAREGKIFNRLAPCDLSIPPFGKGRLERISSIEPSWSSRLRGKTSCCFAALALLWLISLLALVNNSQCSPGVAQRNPGSVTLSTDAGKQYSRFYNS